VCLASPLCSHLCSMPSKLFYVVWLNVNHICNSFITAVGMMGSHLPRDTSIRKLLRQERPATSPSYFDICFIILTWALFFNTAFQALFLSWVAKSWQECPCSGFDIYWNSVFGMVLCPHFNELGQQRIRLKEHYPTCHRPCTRSQQQITVSLHNCCVLVIQSGSYGVVQASLYLLYLKPF
jgi:hypothetical protein